MRALYSWYSRYSWYSHSLVCVCQPFFTCRVLDCTSKGRQSIDERWPKGNGLWDPPTAFKVGPPQSWYCDSWEHFSWEHLSWEHWMCVERIWLPGTHMIIIISGCHAIILLLQQQKWAAIAQHNWCLCRTATVQHFFRLLRPHVRQPQHSWCDCLMSAATGAP